MSNLRKRTQNEKNSEKIATVFGNVKNVIEKTGKHKDSGVLVALFYLLVFVVFLVFSIHLVDFLHDYHSDSIIALQSDEFSQHFLPVTCSKDYGNSFKKCLPKKCGRGIHDMLFDNKDLLQLLDIVKAGMSYGGGSGGATIMDLHSGALSYKDKFINIHKVATQVFNSSHFALYTLIKNKIRGVVAKEFDIDERYLYLTKPTFFSRLNNKPAVTSHDEYWHAHIDRVTYGTFYYTSLLYLANHGSDFTGGRFVFSDKYNNKTIEPRFGRVSFFTSGSENKHFVERVESGERYALTVSFTCDKKHAIKDPTA